MISLVCSGKQKKKQVLILLFLCVLLMLLGFFLPFLLDSIFPVDEMKTGELVVLFSGIFVAVIIAAFFQILLHETGHLIFGLLTGYQFSSFRIGRYMWVKHENKIEFRKMHIAGTGGQCLMVPPQMKEEKIPFVLYNLGGVIINLLSSILFVCLFFATGSTPALSVFFFITAAIGVVMALINGIPMQSDVITNDGYNVIALKKDPHALKAFWIQMKINEQIVKGKRLKDMPSEWFVMPKEEAMKNSMVAAIGVLSCNRLMDSLEIEKADKQMEELLKMDTGMVGLHRRLLITDRIFCFLTGKNSTGDIEELLNHDQKRFMKAMKKFPSVLRTRFTVALLYDRDCSEANRIREEFEKIASSYPHQGDVESDRELMAHALEVFQQRIAENTDTKE